MTTETNTIEAHIFLIDRLCSAFGKEVTKKQTDEWLSIMKKVRTDDAANAVQALIETNNRFPTIADFRREVVRVQTERMDKMTSEDVSPVVRKLMAQYKQDDFEWWRDRFGTFAPNARAIVRDTCDKAVRPWRASSAFAKLICELGSEPNHAIRYERMTELAATIATTNGQAKPEQVPTDFVGF